jgi:hypothetical protein
MTEDSFLVLFTCMLTPGEAGAQTTDAGTRESVKSVQSVDDRSEIVQSVDDP